MKELAQLLILLALLGWTGKTLKDTKCDLTILFIHAAIVFIFLVAGTFEELWGWVKGIV